MIAMKEHVETVLALGPMAAMGIIFWISTVTMFSVLREYPPSRDELDDLKLYARVFQGSGKYTVENHYGRPYRVHIYLNIGVYILIVSMAVLSFLTAVHNGGGRLARGWRPRYSANEKQLVWCDDCQGFKPPRAHHCRTCNRCVLKMDHHCVWINACVGNENQLSFILFTAWAPLGCLHSLVLQGACLGWTSMPTIQRSSRFDRLLLIFTVGITVGVIIAVGCLCYIQVLSVLQNMTQIEDFIVEKAVERRKKNKDLAEFKFPYDLNSWNSNVKEFLRHNFGIQASGAEWNVVNGCTLYTLSEEQLEQKREKLENSTTYTIKSTSRTRFGLGFTTWVCGPCIEPSLEVNHGDIVRTFNKDCGWMYGEKVVKVHQNNGNNDSNSDDDTLKVKVPTTKGWFPEQCTGEIVAKAKFS